MRRREFIAGLGSAAASPIATRAQQAGTAAAADALMAAASIARRAPAVALLDLCPDARARAAAIAE
jgi:hypothetical protein